LTAAYHEVSEPAANEVRKVDVQPLPFESFPGPAPLTARSTPQSAKKLSFRRADQHLPSIVSQLEWGMRKNNPLTLALAVQPVASVHELELLAAVWIAPTQSESSASIQVKGAKIGRIQHTFASR